MIILIILILLLIILPISIDIASSRELEGVKVQRITEEQLKSLGGIPLSLNVIGAESQQATMCDVGNSNYVYTITNMLYGNEHFSAFVDPSACYQSNPGVVHPTSISIVLYATADIINCSGFAIQAHIESAEYSGSCASPGYAAECTSDYNVVQISSPGLWLLTFPLNKDCLRLGPFFASITFFNDGGCLPGPLNLVVDDWPQYCNSYNNYEGTWYDIVASYGLVGKLSLFATVEGIDPVPALISVKDVPEDDGGSITLRWRKSVLDSNLYSSVTHYAVWRRLSGDSYTRNLQNIQAGDSFDGAYVPIDYEGEKIRRVPDVGGNAWEWIANIPSHSFDEYAYTVPSLYDSSGSDTHWQYFMITAYTDDPFVYWDSPVDSGYSVDNLKPMAPEGLNGIQSESPQGLLVSWERNAESDLKNYEIYRGLGSGFDMDDASLLTATSDTFFIDTQWSPGAAFYYKVAATDVHGNRSEPSILAPDDITVGALLMSFSAELDGDAIEVQWETSSAVSEYVVCRLDGNRPEFRKIEVDVRRVDGTRYAFTDKETSPGESYRYRIDYIDANEEKTLFETETIEVPEEAARLYQNHPNPFNPSTKIEFYLARRSVVSLTIFDSSGRSVARLIGGAELDRGAHSASWDGRNDEKRLVPSGVYYYRLRTGKESITKKMILVR